MFEIYGKLAVLDGDRIRKIVVFGDIHGDLQALEKGVRRWGAGDLLLFLGDYADRGPSGVEVIETIKVLADRSPSRVLVLKGNHEDYDEGGSPRFYPCSLIDEAERKRSGWEAFLPIFRSLEERMVLSAILPGFAIFAHAGIGPDINEQEDLVEPSARVREHLLWSDPHTRKGARSSPRGAGVLFGPDVSETVLAALGVRYLIRSHQPRRASMAPAFDHGGRVITLNSTRVYGGGPFVVELPLDGLPEKTGEFKRLVIPI